MHARVARNYRTQYHDPVTIVVGETVLLGARDDEWPRFIWGTDPYGRSGWIPDDVLDRDSGEARCIRDYSARELDVDTDESLQLLSETGGWWWCENTRGQQGWVPATHLNLEQHSALRA